MTIILRQYKKVYDRTLLEFLKNGSVPSHEDIVARAGTDLPDISTSFKPVFKFRPQTKSAVFDINLHNKSVKDIKLDLDVLFEELGDVQQNSLQRLLNAELFHGVHTHELKRLDKQLDALLFAIDGGDENFFAEFESFDDLTKTDQVISTPGVVDLSEGAAALPISLKGSFKIDTSHLNSLATSKVTLDKDDAIVVGNIPGTKYGNVFADSVQAWAIECLADVDRPLELTFTFALSSEEFINRITVLPHSVKQQNCKISTSVDNINKKNLKDYAEGIQLKSQYNEASYDFTDRLVEFIHIKLTKMSADTQVDGKFQYIFGLKNISIFTTGREEQAQYQSKAFDFSGSLSAIGKVGIVATESLPQNTTIDWSIGLLDSSDSLVGTMMPITPQGRPAASGPPKTIFLQDVLTNSKYFSTGTGDALNILTSQNIDFYNLQTIDTEPVFGTAALYRGNGMWLRDQSQAVNPVLVKDNYTPFSKGDTQQLYKVSQQIVNASLSTSTDSVVVLDKAPLYDTNKGHTLIPQVGINPEGNTDPTYAVYKATLSSPTTEITLQSKSFSLGAQLDLGVKNIVYSGPGDIVITNETDTKVYQDGYDYIVDLDDDGNPTGIIVALQPSVNDPGLPKDLGVTPFPSVSIKYTVDPDLTRFVTKITGKQIFFDLNVNNLPGSQIVIKYRHISEGIIKSSIKVKGFYGAAGNAQIFTQGKDYIYDATTSQVQRLTTGAISPGTNVYVDYKFNDLSEELDQFFLWVNVGDKKTVNINLQKTTSTDLSVQNNLKADVALEEQLLAQIPGIGLIDLTDAVTWPEMTGWVQFVVRSIPPEDLLKTSKEPLVHQVMKLKDEQGNFVFVEGGKYFGELTAIREPLTQVGFNYLKTNVLKGDDNKFAIKTLALDAGNQYQVVVNFAPNTSTKLYQYGPVGTGTVEGGPDGLYPIDENWRLIWTTKEINTEAATKVIVAATLSRTPEASGGNITPKAYDYIVKTGF